MAPKNSRWVVSHEMCDGRSLNNLCVLGEVPTADRAAVAVRLMTEQTGSLGGKPTDRGPSGRCAGVSGSGGECGTRTAAAYKDGGAARQPGQLPCAETRLSTAGPFRFPEAAGNSATNSHYRK